MFQIENLLMHDWNQTQYLRIGRPLTTTRPPVLSYQHILTSIDSESQSDNIFCQSLLHPIIITLSSLFPVVFLCFGQLSPMQLSKLYAGLAALAVPF